MLARRARDLTDSLHEAGWPVSGLRACSYGGEPARLPGWSFLPRSHLIPNSNTKFDSVRMRRRACPLSEVSLVYWRDFGRRDENFPI